MFSQFKTTGQLVVQSGSSQEHKKLHRELRDSFDSTFNILRMAWTLVTGDAAKQTRAVTPEFLHEWVNERISVKESIDFLQERIDKNKKALDALQENKSLLEKQLSTLTLESSEKEVSFSQLVFISNEISMAVRTSTQLEKSIREDKELLAAKLKTQDSKLLVLDTKMLNLLKASPFPKGDFHKISELRSKTVSELRSKTDREYLIAVDQERYGAIAFVWDKVIKPYRDLYPCELAGKPVIPRYNGLPLQTEEIWNVLFGIHRALQISEYLSNFKGIKAILMDEWLYELANSSGPHAAPEVKLEKVLKRSEARKDGRTAQAWVMTKQFFTDRSYQQKNMVDQVLSWRSKNIDMPMDAENLREVEESIGYVFRNYEARRTIAESKRPEFASLSISSSVSSKSPRNAPSETNSTKTVVSTSTKDSAVKSQSDISRLKQSTPVLRMALESLITSRADEKETPSTQKIQLFKDTLALLYVALLQMLQDADKLAKKLGVSIEEIDSYKFKMAWVKTRLDLVEGLSILEGKIVNHKEIFDSQLPRSERDEFEAFHKDEVLLAELKKIAQEAKLSRSDEVQLASLRKSEKDDGLSEADKILLAKLEEKSRWPQSAKAVLEKFEKFTKLKDYEEIIDEEEALLRGQKNLERELNKLIQGDRVFTFNDKVLQLLLSLPLLNNDSSIIVKLAKRNLADEAYFDAIEQQAKAQEKGLIALVWDRISRLPKETFYEARRKKLEALNGSHNTALDLYVSHHESKLMDKLRDPSLTQLAQYEKHLRDCLVLPRGQVSSSTATPFVVTTSSSADLSTASSNGSQKPFSGMLKSAATFMMGLFVSSESKSASDISSNSGSPDIASPIADSSVSSSSSASCAKLFTAAAREESEAAARKEELLDSVLKTQASQQQVKSNETSSSTNGLAVKSKDVGRSSPSTLTQGVFAPGVVTVSSQSKDSIVDGIWNTLGNK